MDDEDGVQQSSRLIDLINNTIKSFHSLETNEKSTRLVEF